MEGRTTVRNIRFDRTAERDRREIDERTFEFAAAILRLARELPADTPRHIVDQVARLGTEIGAQVDEAQRSNSRRRHLSEMAGARRDCGRLPYWLNLLVAIEAVPEEAMEPFLSEAQYLYALLTDICIVARQHLPENEPVED
ncbi:MAG: four helix bundle protein [FCB group bacterium]|jgi:four helix bundle protein|nr:four helix bundle protein [FCB group bacterium]